MLPSYVLVRTLAERDRAAASGFAAATIMRPRDVAVNGDNEKSPKAEINCELSRLSEPRTSVVGREA